MAQPGAARHGQPMLGLIDGSERKERLQEGARQKETPQGTLLLPPSSGSPPNRPLALSLRQLPVGRTPRLAPWGTIIIYHNRQRCQDPRPALAQADAVSRTITRRFLIEDTYRCHFRCPNLRQQLGLQYAHERQISVPLPVVEPVADDEFVRDLEPDVVQGHVHQPPCSLVQQSADPQRGGTV